ncbi:MAG: phytanoyl-CoA dioxygenase family protein [Anaerolineaceae bacterium]|nr:phytanoyl-CoA dioxygenase family protein [Anaerolineaceae bacterium]
MDYDLQDYLFDLRGYLILKNAVNLDLVSRLNKCLDTYIDLKYLDWRGNVQRFDNNGVAGIELQNIVEGGEPFEEMIDHPSWIDRVHRYCGEDGSYVDGLFIDECFASIRRAGGYFPVHSGGQDGVIRNQYRFINGKFRCGQVNILLALTDIGLGDGGTMIIPGSHKSNITHPDTLRPWDELRQMDTLDGAIEVHLQKGDALLFVDALAHGSSTRTNPGERRVVIYRYGPTWGSTRHGYVYSPELLDRLTPERRKILQPIIPRVPEMKMV